MINSHNTFSPLKEIIIGDVDIGTIQLEDHRKQSRIEYIFQKTKDELTKFQYQLGCKISISIAMTNVLAIQRIPSYWSQEEK